MTWIAPPRKRCGSNEGALAPIARTAIYCFVISRSPVRIRPSAPFFQALIRHYLKRISLPDSDRTHLGTSVGEARGRAPLYGRVGQAETVAAWTPAAHAPARLGSALDRVRIIRKRTAQQRDCRRNSDSGPSCATESPPHPAAGVGPVFAPPERCAGGRHHRVALGLTLPPILAGSRAGPPSADRGWR